MLCTVSCISGPVGYYTLSAVLKSKPLIHFLSVIRLRNSLMKEMHNSLVKESVIDITVRHCKY